MQKYFIIKLLLLFVMGNAVGQMTLKEAQKITDEYIFNLKLSDYLLYCNPDIFTSKTEIITFDKSIYSSSFDSWVFFLDKNPLANWTHPCLFLFINVNTGRIEEIEWKLPPNNLDEWQILTEIKEQSEVKLFNFKKISTTVLKTSLTPDNCYAVIISGGYNRSNNWQRYWNDCSAIYSALVDVYNYEDDHIYTVISDGTSTGTDRRISGGYDSSPLDLDGDGDNDIQFSATRANITSVFNTLY